MLEYELRELPRNSSAHVSIATSRRALAWSPSALRIVGVVIRPGNVAVNERTRSAAPTALSLAEAKIVGHSFAMARADGNTAVPIPVTTVPLPSTALLIPITAVPIPIPTVPLPRTAGAAVPLGGTAAQCRAAAGSCVPSAASGATRCRHLPSARSNADLPSTTQIGITNCDSRFIR